MSLSLCKKAVLRLHETKNHFPAGGDFTFPENIPSIAVSISIIDNQPKVVLRGSLEPAGGVICVQEHCPGQAQKEGDPKMNGFHLIIPFVDGWGNTEFLS